MCLTRRMLWLVALMALGLGLSCAKNATTTVAQSQQLSQSAMAYADTISTLIDTAIDIEIDKNNRAVLKDYAELKDVDDVEARKSALSEILTTSDKALTDKIDAMRNYKAQLVYLKAYFQNLQALANADVKEDTTSAVANLGLSIDAFNKRLNRDPNLQTFTADQQGALGGLAGLVADNIRAEKLRAALKRDAEKIGVFFAMQDKIIQYIGESLKAGNDLIVNEKQRRLAAQFEDVEIANPSQWAQARKEILLSHFSNDALLAAQNASRALMDIWQAILKGEDDIGSIQAFLANIDTFTAALQSVKDAQQAADEASDEGDNL